MMHLIVIILEKFSEALNEFRMNLDYFRSDTQYKTKQKKNPLYKITKSTFSVILYRILSEYRLII